MGDEQKNLWENQITYSGFQLSPIHSKPHPVLRTPLSLVRRGERGEVYLYSIQVKTAILPITYYLLPITYYLLLHNG